MSPDEKADQKLKNEQIHEEEMLEAEPDNEMLEVEPGNEMLEVESDNEMLEVELDNEMLESEFDMEALETEETENIDKNLLETININIDGADQEINQ